MKPTPESYAARAGWPGPFTWSGWLVVLMVLLSALPSSAQPRSRITGSAFDPAAVSVTLKVKARDQADAKGSDAGPAPLKPYASGDLTTDQAATVSEAVGRRESIGVAVLSFRSGRRMMGLAGPRAPPIERSSPQASSPL